MPALGLILAEVQYDDEERERLGLPEWSWVDWDGTGSVREQQVQFPPSLNPPPSLPAEYDDAWFGRMVLDPAQRAALSAEGREAFEQWEAWVNRRNAGKRIAAYREQLGLPPLTEGDWAELCRGSALIDESIRLGTLVGQAESVPAVESLPADPTANVNGRGP